MFGHISAITLKELKILWKDRTALALLFAMPLFFILVMSFALEGVFESGKKNRPVVLLVVNQDQGTSAKKALEELTRIEGLVFQPTLQGIPLTLDRAEDLIKRKAYAMALVFQSDFSKKIRDVETPEEAVYLIMDPAINQQLAAPVKGAIRGTLERIIQTTRLSQVLSIPGEDKNSELASLGKDAAPFVLKTIPPREYKSNRFPTAVEQNVPAYTIFGVFFIIVTLASSFLKEKRDGTFLRILAAPLSSTALLIGKLIPYYLVNLVQIALMFFVGVVIFGMKLGSLPGLILVSLALALTANGLGLLIASLGKTEGQINGLSVLLVVTLAALGGMMVPTFIMPPVMRTLSLFTPHAWALAGYHDVIIRGLGIRAVLPEAGMLLGFAGFFFFAALWRFRF
jgi:ABC-2 type transport system permease protein